MLLLLLLLFAVAAVAVAALAVAAVSMHARSYATYENRGTWILLKQLRIVL